MNDDQQEFLEAQEFFGLATLAPVQKDFHVARLIRAVASVQAAPFTLVFSGGTALARAHKVIQRMSEDVDFKIVSSDGFVARKSKLRSLLSAVKADITAAIRAAGFMPGEPHVRNENRYIRYDVPYESATPIASGLRAAIQAELTYAPLRREPLFLPVASFVSEAFGRSPEVAAIACASITETAAEKLIALTRRTSMVAARGPEHDDATLVRHIYDLHAIRAHYAPEAVIELAREIMRADADSFAHQYPAYRDDPLAETRKALNLIASDSLYARRYATFQAEMVYGPRFDFADALATLQALVSQLERGAC